MAAFPAGVDSNARSAGLPTQTRSQPRVRALPFRAAPVRRHRLANAAHDRPAMSLNRASPQSRRVAVRVAPGRRHTILVAEARPLIEELREFQRGVEVGLELCADVWCSLPGSAPGWQRAAICPLFRACRMPSPKNGIDQSGGVSRQQHAIVAGLQRVQAVPDRQRVGMKLQVPRACAARRAVAR